MATKLLRALKQKFSSPAAVLKKLGLDAALIRDDEPVSSGMPSLPAATELHNLLAEKFSHIKDDEEVARIFELVEELGDARREAGDRVSEKVESMPPEMAASDDKRDDRLEPFREHLRDKGMSEDEIDHACGLARDHIRRRHSNGHDVLPRNRLLGGRGGHFGGSRSGPSFDAIAAARSRMAEIESEPMEDRRRGAMDAKPELAPSRAQRAQFYQKYPGSERLLDLAGTGL